MEITAIWVYPPCFFHPLLWPGAATAHARGTIARSAKVRNRWKYITFTAVWQGPAARFFSRGCTGSPANAPWLPG